ncbi:MAG TPA: extracellular solute-binding protein [Candidatus Binatia bacterium]|jgi:iron(III) transport system substrate-binding protein|nr:extracellular solute-binding protein [Candidatus Binatia bacterium]
MRGFSRDARIFFALLAILSVFVSTAAVNAAQADWKKDWEQTLAAAKKEGQVTIYIYRYEGLLQDFKREFPGINVVSVSGRGNDLTTRIMAERRAGKFIADVYSGGTNSLFNILYKGKALDPIKPLLTLPEVTDLSKWYGKEHRYADPEGKFIFAFIGSASNAQLAYHTKMVDPKEFKSYWDVTNPKWKGKIVSLDPRDTGLGATMQFYYYSPEIGPEYMKKFFGGMDITYVKNFQQMTNWLAQGKFAICMGCKDSMRAKNQGLPVDDFDTNRWKEGSSFSAGGGSMGYMNQAPHPNAAKVFINWFLSRKGQMALQKLGDPDDPANSRRIDIPKDDIPPDSRLQPGVKYFDVVKPEYGDMKPIFDLAKEIMAGVEKK